MIRLKTTLALPQNVKNRQPRARGASATGRTSFPPALLRNQLFDARKAEKPPGQSRRGAVPPPCQFSLAHMTPEGRPGGSDGAGGRGVAAPQAFGILNQIVNHKVLKSGFPENAKWIAANHKVTLRCVQIYFLRPNNQHQNFKTNACGRHIYTAYDRCSLCLLRLGRFV